MISKFYYENIIRSILLSKYNYTNIHEMVSFKDCVITITFSNENIEEDMNILHALTLLELLTSQKPYIKKVSSVYRSKIKTLVFVFQISLRKFNFFDFLVFFYFVALPMFNLRYVKRNLEIDARSFSYNFAFKDTNVFPSLPEVYYKWNSLLNFSFTIMFTEKASIKEIEDFYNFFYLLSDLNNKEDYFFDDLDPFIVSDTDILSLSFFNSKISLAIIEFERKNNEIENEEKEQV